jgi:cold shock CspA family protein
VLHDDFDRLTVGTEVRFNPEEGEDGTQASSVQVVGRSASI